MQQLVIEDESLRVNILILIYNDIKVCCYTYNALHVGNGETWNHRMIAYINSKLYILTCLEKPIK